MEICQYKRIDMSRARTHALVMKSSQLQIRVSPDQKATLRRLAEEAGQDLSEYVLSRVLPDAGRQFSAVLRGLQETADERHRLAELNDLLSMWSAAELAALPSDGIDELGGTLRCRIAAMVEHACARAGGLAPTWAGDEPPLEAPSFAVPLRSLRLHLLKTSPVAFRRRNIFVDATVGDRI